MGGFANICAAIAAFGFLVLGEYLSPAHLLNMPRWELYGAAVSFVAFTLALGILVLSVAGFGWIESPTRYAVLLLCIVAYQSVISVTSN